jgi:alpha-tubulin suppressor-like RCC1 family protein
MIDTLKTKVSTLTSQVTGCSGYGQLGLDVHENINTFKNTELVVNTVKCFNNCTMIINDDGTTYVTGNNYKGRLISNYDNDTIQEFTQIPDFIHKMSTNRFKKTKSARN